MPRSTIALDNRELLLTRKADGYASLATGRAVQQNSEPLGSAATLIRLARNPMLQFEWDPAKAESNRRKHGIDFGEAATAFGDPLSLTIPDPEHSVGEERFILIGVSYRNRLVVVAHSEDGDTIRIISARSATAAERNAYEQD